MSLKGMLIHTADVYTSTAGSLDASGKTTYTFVSNLAGLKCFVQPAPSKVITEYQQTDEDITHTLFHATGSLSCGVNDRVTFKSNNYRIIGKRNACEMNRVYRLDLRLEQV